jgi:peptidoglycan/xylan/chitin deacetylase (PgdA/CDA1 family)
MTESIKNYRRSKFYFFRATKWGGFFLFILLVVFLFPSSQLFYVIADSRPPLTTKDGTNENTHVDPENPDNSLADDFLFREQDKNQDKNKEEGGTRENLEIPHTSEKPEGFEKDERFESGKAGKPGDSFSSQEKTVPDVEEGDTPVASPDDQASVSAPVFRGNPLAGKKVAITFDDGPYAIWTEEYLQVLEEYEVPAAFFLVGTRVERYPEIARKIAEKGFDLGGHSYSHGRLTLVKQEMLDEDFQKTIAALNKAGAVNMFRPPYGEYNRPVTDTAVKYGLTTIGWNVDPRDWETKDQEKIIQHVLTHAKDGSIILLHEGRESTLAALPQIITGLRDMGYQLVRVADLMK